MCMYVEGMLSWKSIASPYCYYNYNNNNNNIVIIIIIIIRKVISKLLIRYC